MPLTNKFLRYSPEITLEILTLVQDKLKLCGMNSLSAKENYNYFKKGYEYLVGTHKNFFYTREKNSPDLLNKSETTVQEILGYDPFVKDDFVLPKKWCIKSQSRDQDYLINGFARSCGGGHWNDEDNHARNNYLNISDGEYHRGSRNLDKDFIEITFDQFKKYVLKDHIETSKETTPEYVECINSATCNTKVGEIFKCRHSNGCFEWEYNNKSMSSYNSWDGWSVPWSDKLPQKHFKPSTKKAFDAQNKPKSIGLNKFPTEGHCKTDSIELRDYLFKRSSSRTTLESEWIKGKSIGVGWDEGSYWVISEKSSKPEYQLSQLEKFFIKEDSKKPSKQAVHCQTQEEYKFAKETLGATFNSNAYIKDESIIPLDAVGSTINLNRFGHSVYNDYQLLSFQEWCDLNGYKMEKEVKFEVGKWHKAYYAEKIYFLKYKNTIPRNGYNQINYSEFINNGVYKANDSISNTDLENSFKVLDDLEEIQQYLPDDHPDKISPVIQQARDMQSRNDLKKGDYLYVLLPSYCGDILEITGVGDDSRYEANSIWITHKNKSFSGGGFRCSDKTHPFGVEVRLATPEEINNHLISIGENPAIKDAADYVKHYGLEQLGNEIHRQVLNSPEELKIPAGEPLNNGIEPNKDGMFRYSSKTGSSWTGLTPTNHLGAMYQVDIMGKPVKPKMILSIDDEELPMVSIIKTNSIKQLLNND